jgi:hypothetical protein
MRAQIVGGRNDGRLVEYIGPFLRLPVPPLLERFTAAADVSVSESPRMRIEEFRAERGLDGERYYVLTGTSDY